MRSKVEVKVSNFEKHVHSSTSIVVERKLLGPLIAEELLQFLNAPTSHLHKYAIFKHDLENFGGENDKIIYYIDVCNKYLWL